MGHRAFVAGVAKTMVGLRPSFSAHVRFGERGAPVLSRRDRLASRVLTLTLQAFQKILVRCRPALHAGMARAHGI
jgi:hypothetical protein